MSRKNPIRMLMGVLLGVGLWWCSATAEPTKLVLALGDNSYVPTEAVMGAQVANELGDRDLMEFAVVILSNIPYNQLPGAVQERLTEFLDQGGSLLITGGPNAYGSGGYQPMAAFVPFEIRTRDDWRSVPFKEVIPIQPDHPILRGVTFRTVGSFNDLNPKPAAVEIAQYAGGRTGFPSPLIAEQRVGQGTVVGVALDLGRELQNGWRDGNRFVQNLLTYLVTRSP
ncbi:MAG: hypothetical protein ACE1Z6_04960 [Candidatus Methylomirabilales bacterium]|nr:hypothetical protein [candidate division NC10 bacterium]